MNILTQTATIVKTNFLPYVASKHRGLFEFGIKALSLSSFNSLNSNARRIITNDNTAHSKLKRCLKTRNTSLISKSSSSRKDKPLRFFFGLSLPPSG